MSHIQLSVGAPSLISLLRQYPQTRGPLLALVQVLLRRPSPLTPAQRELIAAYVSEIKGCVVCAESHSAAAWHLPGGEAEIVEPVRAKREEAPVDETMRA